MANDREWYKNPPVIVALGFASAPVLAALLWGLSVLVETLLGAVGALLQTVAIALGVAWTIAVSGVIAAGAVPTWVVPAASLGVATAGITVCGRVAITVVNKVQENPIQIWLPILGILGGLSVDVAQEFLAFQPIVQHGLSAFAGIMVIAAGVLYQKGGKLLTAGCFVLHLIPAALIIVKAVQLRGAESIEQALSAVPFASWVALGSFGVVAVATLGIAVSLIRSGE